MKKKPIGTGAFAQVYLVRHKKTKVHYAIKLIQKKIILKRGTLEAIKQEVEIMYKLKSDHIVKLVDHFEDDKRVYLVMEYVSGGTLLEKYCRARRNKNKIPETKVA